MEKNKSSKKGKSLLFAGLTATMLACAFIPTADKDKDSIDATATTSSTGTTYFNTKTHTGAESTYNQYFTDKLANKDVKIEYKTKPVTFADGYQTTQYSKVKTTRTDSDKIYTPTEKYTFQTGDGVTMKNWYKPHNGSVNGERRTFQNFAFGKGSDAYLSFATGDLKSEGYIYHYDSKGNLKKMSPKIKMGHGQSISYHKGYMYVGADMPKKEDQRIYKYNVDTWEVEQEWKLPADITVGTMVMRDANTAVVARKYDIDRGYELLMLKLDPSSDTAQLTTSYRFPGVVGTTKQYELQSIAYHDKHYYLATNGYYVKINEDTRKRTNVRVPIERENEGIGFSKTGRLVWGVAQPNELFIEK